MPALAGIPLSLYIHIPWCVKKCPYCDFNSHALDYSPLQEQAYIQALLDDLQQALPQIWGRNVQSIFIGGGTPSLFSAQSYEKLLSAIRALLPLSANAEITLEANPGTADANNFYGYRQAGINRLSIGIQSFDDRQLQQLGRIHDSQQAQSAIKLAQKAGFDNINLDLMFGLPQQNLQQALDDLKTATRYRTLHLSWYQLTLEPNTLFYQKPPPLPEDDLLAEMMQQGKALLAQQGFEQYEISAYCRNRQQCKHNLNYWQFGDYLGIGAGAHSKLSDATSGRVMRQSRWRSPKDYLNKTDKVRNQTQLQEKDLLLEFLMNRLRTRQGFDAETLFFYTGLKLEKYQQIFAQGYEKGLLQKQQGKIMPTEQGQLYLNETLLLFS